MDGLSTDLATLSRRFRRFGERECVPASPLYGQLAVGIAGDANLLLIAAGARAGPVPNLFLAAVHFLLLQGAAHPLAEFYPDLAGRAARAPDDDPFPLFRAFCLAHAGAIGELIATRLVQTNEVRRCACLMPAFAAVARQAGDRPLALVEVGASAGLNLLWDRYHYDYGAAGSCGDPRSPVRLACELRGDRQPKLPADLPAVGFRVGLDLSPIDVCDGDAALWLRALIWPEQLDRAELLGWALEIAQAHPPPLVAGDALDLLPAVLASAESDAALCLFHTFVLNQFPAAARERFADLVAEHAARRDLSVIAIEWREPYPSVVLTSFRSGARFEKTLAHCDAHGGWLAWLESSHA